MLAKKTAGPRPPYYFRSEEVLVVVLVVVLVMRRANNQPRQCQNSPPIVCVASVTILKTRTLSWAIRAQRWGSHQPRKQEQLRGGLASSSWVAGGRHVLFFLFSIVPLTTKSKWSAW